MSDGTVPLEESCENMMFTPDAWTSLLAILNGPGPLLPKMPWLSLLISCTSEIHESRIAVEALLMMRPLRRLPGEAPWMEQHSKAKLEGAGAPSRLTPA